MSKTYSVVRADHIGDTATAASMFPTYADSGRVELGFVLLRGGSIRVGYFADRDAAQDIADILNREALFDRQVAALEAGAPFDPEDEEMRRRAMDFVLS